MDEPLQLNPAQQRTLALLRRSSEPTLFDATFVDELREEANEAFAQFSDRLDSHTLFVTKHTLASVHDCEVHFLAPDD